MPYEQRDNSGTLFKNHKWTDAPDCKHPRYRGEGMVFGKLVWISAWVKQGKKGPFITLALQPKEEPKSEPAPEQPNLPAEPKKDDVPF